MNTTITENTTLGELLAILGPVAKAEKTPTPKKLRDEAGEPIAMEERCKVYANGYAVYENGYGTTVLWVPNCTTYFYAFDPMKDTEKGGEIKQGVALPEGFLESQPWMIALTLIGDHRIENLSMRRKADRKQNKCLIRGNKEEGEMMEDLEEQEDPLFKEIEWRDNRFGEDPESVLIRKERQNEILNSMTEKQRRVFVLYYMYGYNQSDIAAQIGTSQQNVAKLLASAVKKAKKYF